MKKIQTEIELKFVELYKKGCSMQKIAEMFNVSAGTVHYYLKQHIPIDERRRRQFRGKLLEELDIERMKELYKRGLSSIALSKRFGVCPETILKHLKKVGIDTSKNKKFASKINKELLAKIVETYKLTGSILQTARKFKLHPSSIHYRLTKLGLIKKKQLDQKIVKIKYEKLTKILIELFEKMGYKVRFAQKRYNWHGPDMILEKNGKIIIVEHKATVKRSRYWTHAIKEAKAQMKKFHADASFVISTASKPGKIETYPKITLIFYEDLKEFLIKFDIGNSIKDLDYIASTPSV